MLSENWSPSGSKQYLYGAAPSWEEGSEEADLPGVRDG